ncbi:hypothetical protein GPALN_011768 [Globodera pallida]|nr:hypothetical protein GPALN_011768 [Globodera pallida]
MKGRWRPPPTASMRRRSKYWGETEGGGKSLMSATAQGLFVLEKYEHLQRGKSKQSESNKITKFVSRSTGTLSVLDKKIVNFSVCCDIPFLVINHPTFKTLVRNQSENLRDESHYRKKALPEVYKIVKDKVKSEVTAMDQIRFTTDIWTSDTTKDAFISSKQSQSDCKDISDELLAYKNDDCVGMSVDPLQWCFQLPPQASQVNSCLVLQEMYTITAVRIFNRKLPK